MNTTAPPPRRRSAPPVIMPENHNQTVMDSYAGKPQRRAAPPSLPPRRSAPVVEEKADVTTADLPSSHSSSLPRRRSAPSATLAAACASEGLRVKEPILPEWPLKGSLTLFLKATDKAGLTLHASVNPANFPSPESIEEWIKDNMKMHSYSLLSVSGKKEGSGCHDLHVLYSPDGNDPLVADQRRLLLRINAACNKLNIP